MEMVTDGTSDSYCGGYGNTDSRVLLDDDLKLVAVLDLPSGVDDNVSWSSGPDWRLAEGNRLWDCAIAFLC